MRRALRDDEVHRMNRQFQEALARGYSLQVVVAVRLLEAELWVRLPALRVAPTFEERNRYKDDGDLLIGVRGRPAVRLEVKSTRFPFTEGGKDFPFARPYVETKQAWESKVNKPVAVVLVSQVTRAMAVIPCSTSPTWTIRVATIEGRDYDSEFLTVSRDDLRPMEELVKWLMACSQGQRGEVF